MASLNNLEVKVSADTRDLRRGLRGASHEQRRYGRETRRMNDQLNRMDVFTGGRVSRGAGIAGRFGLGRGAMALGGGMAAGAAAGAMSFRMFAQEVRAAAQAYDSFNDTQRRTLTSGQREWMRFSSGVNQGLGLLDVIRQEMMGRVVRALGLGGMTEDFERLNQQRRERFGQVVARAPAAALRRGSVGEMQAISRIQQQQRELGFRREQADIIRNQREQAVNQFMGSTGAQVLATALRVALGPLFNDMVLAIGQMRMEQPATGVE